MPGQQHLQVAEPQQPSRSRPGVPRARFARRYRWSLAAATVLLVGAGLATATLGGAGPAPIAEGGGPLGVPGSWREVWGDEFTGTALDTSRWYTEEDEAMNNVTAHSSNVRVAGGNLILTLASATSGAFVCSHPVQTTLADGYQLPVGGYVEARVSFPGNGATIDNWPAWWVSGLINWPASGEHDIAEGLGGLTVNYHSAGRAKNLGTVPGVWSNGFHVYGLYRGKGHADVYWDGRLVGAYRTDDTGAGHALIFNVGAGSPAGAPNGSMPVYGAGSQVKVDYVRAYQPA